MAAVRSRSFREQPPKRRRACSPLVVLFEPCEDFRRDLAVRGDEASQRLRSRHPVAAGTDPQPELALAGAAPVPHLGEIGLQRIVTADDDSDPASFLQTCSVTSHPPCSSGSLAASPARLRVPRINRSVFFRQQHGRYRPVGFGDDVEPGLPVLAPVGGEKPTTVGEGALVLALIFFGQLAQSPVAWRLRVSWISFAESLSTAPGVITSWPSGNRLSPTNMVKTRGGLCFMSLRRVGPHVRQGLLFLHGPIPHAFPVGRASRNCWGPAHRERAARNGGRGRPAARRSAARGMTGSKGGGGGVVGEPGGPRASGARRRGGPGRRPHGGVGRASPAERERGSPARGAVGPNSRGSGIGPGEIPRREERRHLPRSENAGRLPRRVQSGAGRGLAPAGLIS